MMNWLSQSAFNRPSTFDAMANGWLFYSCPPAPLHQGKPLSIVFKNVVITFIVSLLLWCRPLTIGFKISKAIINTVNGVLWAGFVAHIGIKVFERVAPSVTYGYAYASISWVTLYFIVQAPVFNVLPCSILGRRAKSMSCKELRCCVTS